MTDRAPHALSPGQIAEGLHPRRVGRRIVVLPEIDSTNSYALQMLAVREGEAADGTVVFAERQTTGRGRLGRSWHSPAGASVMCTTLLNEPVHVARPAFWMMTAGLAVVRAIEAATVISPTIRWPNDVYVGSRKVAGILVEASVVAGGSDLKTPISIGAASAWLAIGIGINCLQQAAHFPPEIRNGATSLDIESKSPIDRMAVARALVMQMDGFFADPASIDDDRLAAEWCAASADIGARVVLACGEERHLGVILDVHPREGLVLQLDDGPRRHFDPATTSRVK